MAFDESTAAHPYLMWPPSRWVLSKSNSSYGNWALRMGECTIRFFWKKRDAVAFWDTNR